MIHGIGIDLVQKSRVKAALQRWGDHFLNRILTQSERELCEKKGDKIGSIAVRFAAKEAIMKALGTGWTAGVSWKQIEILSDIQGRPQVILSGQAAIIAGNSGVHLSLSHEHETAIAFVILESKIS